MQELFTAADYITGAMLFIVFIVLFHLSIKKCFWTATKGKAKLFLLTFFTNPIVAFVIIMLVVAIITSIVYLMTGYFSTFNAGKDGVEEQKTVILVSMITWAAYMVIMFLISHIVGKRLNVPNKSLVTFVYLMFSVFIIFQFKNGVNFNENIIISHIISTVDTLVQTMAVVFLYHFDIKALSKLTSQKREVNWKLFVIAPTLLSCIYVVFCITQFYNIQLTMAVIIFSYILIFLFIWAFHVIIQNIIFTNDAIKARDEVKVLSVEVMEALAHTIDAKDEYTRGHSVRVAKYSRMLAQRLNLTSEECENVYYMALLHDIGKIGVPNEIINSTTKLTDDEYAVIKTHPGVGYDILAEIKSRPDLSIGARWHHERYDGKGYPDGKKGEEIPFFARIIAVADSYDAMTSNRSYRKYMPQDKVRFEIENNIGSQFDPDVAKCMLSIIDEDVDYELHE